MRRGEYDEAELERQLEIRGFFYRFFGRWMNAVNSEPIPASPPWAHTPE